MLFFGLAGTKPDQRPNLGLVTRGALPKAIGGHAPGSSSDGSSATIARSARQIQLDRLPDDAWGDGMVLVAKHIADGGNVAPRDIGALGLEANRDVA